MSQANLAHLTPFEDILDQLEALARDHLLFYRVQVGSLLLRHFWADDAAAFSDHSPNKDVRFELFFQKCGEELARYGLSKRQARNSIRASIVVRTLPPSVAEKLFLSQVLELVRLRDPTQRAELASVAIASDWSMRQLRDAVTAVRAGLPLDGEPDVPGVQVLEVEDAVPRLTAGRMVTRVEKLAGAVEAWAEGWEQADASVLKDAQRTRLEAAVATLEAQVAALRAGLKR